MQKVQRYKKVQWGWNDECANRNRRLWVWSMQVGWLGWLIEISTIRRRRKNKKMKVTHWMGRNAGNGNGETAVKVNRQRRVGSGWKRTARENGKVKNATPNWRHDNVEQERWEAKRRRWLDEGDYPNRERPGCCNNGEKEECIEGSKDDRYYCISTTSLSETLWNRIYKAEKT